MSAKVGFLSAIPPSACTDQYTDRVTPWSAAQLCHQLRQLRRVHPLDTPARLKKIKSRSKNRIPIIPIAANHEKKATPRRDNILQKKLVPRWKTNSPSSTLQLPRVKVKAHRGKLQGHLWASSAAISPSCVRGTSELNWFGKIVSIFRNIIRIPWYLLLKMRWLCGKSYKYMNDSNTMCKPVLRVRISFQHQYMPCWSFAHQGTDEPGRPGSTSWTRHASCSAICHTFGADLVPGDTQRFASLILSRTDLRFVLQYLQTLHVCCFLHKREWIRQDAAVWNLSRVHTLTFLSSSRALQWMVLVLLHVAT